MSGDGARKTGGQAIREHVRECAACAAERPTIDRVQRILDRDALSFDATLLSRRVVQQAQPVLDDRVQAAWRREGAIALLVAVFPLPAVLMFDAYLLRLVHATVASLSSAALATYLVFTYASVVALLFALTYADIPIYMANAMPRRPAAH